MAGPLLQGMEASHRDSGWEGALRTGARRVFPALPSTRHTGPLRDDRAPPPAQGSNTDINKKSPNSQLQTLVLCSVDENLESYPQAMEISGRDGRGGQKQDERGLRAF